MTTDTLDRPAADAAAAPAEDIFTPVKALAMPDTVTAQRTANNAVRMAEGFVIVSQEDFTLAAEELASIKGKWNKMEAQRTSITGPMNKALDAINALFKGPMSLLKQAENTLKASMLAFSEEQERKAAAEKKKRDEEAAAAQKIIDDQAREVERKAALERQQLADAAADRAREDAKKLEELEKQAVQAQQSGDTAQLEAIEEQIGMIVETSDLASRQERQQAAQIDESATVQAANLRAAAPAVTSMVATYGGPAKAAGVSKSVTYDYELLDMAKLVKHIGENPALANLLAIDSVKMRAYVKSLGANANLPGVRVFTKGSISSRAKA
ncbi:hypothetical protein D9M73_65270 [compost metagenome]